MTDDMHTAAQDGSDAVSPAYPDLRALREAKGLSLQHIYEVTRISHPNLRAIENGAFGLLPAAAYSRQFIRQYAEVTGADANVLLAAYERYLQSRTVPQEKDGRGADRKRRQIRFGKWLLWLLPAAAVIIAALWLWSGRPPAPQVTPAPPVQTAPGPRPDAAPAPEPSSPADQKPPAAVQPSPAIPPKPETTPGKPAPETGPKPEATAEKSSAATAPKPGAAAMQPAPAAEKKPAAAGEPTTPPAAPKPQAAGPAPAAIEAKPAARAAAPGPAPEKKYRLLMAAREPVWVSIREEGRAPEQMILQAGQSLEKAADRPLALHIGNAGGIAITFQGKPVGDVGKRGQVVRLRFPAD